METTDTNRRPARSRVFTACAALLALLIALVLQFSAAGKLLGPNPKLVIFEPGHATFAEGLLRDHAIAGVEMVLVILLAFAFRSRFIWPLVALFFAGLLGYSGYALVSGRDCGCFGALWTPPKGFTVGINTLFVLGSLGLLLGVRMKKTAVVTAVLCLGAAGAGYYQARVDLPPLTPENNPFNTGPTDGSEGTGTDEPVADTGGDTGNKTGSENTSAQPAAGGSIYDVPEIRERLDDAPGEHLVYVFLYEVGCSSCEMVKPFVEDDRLSLDGTGAPITIVSLDMAELESRYGIPSYTWAGTPTVVALDGGAIAYYDHGEDVTTPNLLLEPWLAGEELGGKDPDEVWGG